MIDQETWKIGTDHDKMEKLIKYNMMYNTIKAFFWKKKAFSSKVKQFTFFLWMVAFKTHLGVIGKFIWIGKMTHNVIKKDLLTPCTDKSSVHLTSFFLSESHLDRVLVWILLYFTLHSRTWQIGSSEYVPWFFLYLFFKSNFCTSSWSTSFKIKLCLFRFFM